MQLRKDCGGELRAKDVRFFPKCRPLPLCCLASGFLLRVSIPTPRIQRAGVRGCCALARGDQRRGACRRPAGRVPNATPPTRAACAIPALWRYSRHPKLLFRVAHLGGVFRFALGSPWGWAALIGPASILYLLLRVTAYPLTEEQSIRSVATPIVATSKQRAPSCRGFPRNPPHDRHACSKEISCPGLDSSALASAGSSRNASAKSPPAMTGPPTLRPQDSRPRRAHRRGERAALRSPNAFLSTLPRPSPPNSPVASTPPAARRSTRPRRRCSRSMRNAPSSPTASTCSSSAAAGARLCLYNAERFPRARITAISNSRTQRNLSTPRRSTAGSPTSRSSRATSMRSTRRRPNSTALFR